MKDLFTSSLLGIITILLLLFAASSDAKETNENVERKEQLLENKKEFKNPLIETLTVDSKVVNNQKGI